MNLGIALLKLHSAKAAVCSCVYGLLARVATASDGACACCVSSMPVRCIAEALRAAVRAGALDAVVEALRAHANVRAVASKAGADLIGKLIASGNAPLASCTRILSRGRGR
jgi:hypothetical protein